MQPSFLAKSGNALVLKAMATTIRNSSFSQRQIVQVVVFFFFFHFYNNIKSKNSWDCYLLIQYKMKDITLLSFDTCIVIEFPNSEFVC